jgi:hypothetical protein
VLRHPGRLAFLVGIVALVLSGCGSGQGTGTGTAAGGEPRPASAQTRDWQQGLLNRARANPPQAPVWPFKTLVRGSAPPSLEAVATASLGGSEHLGLKFAQAEAVRGAAGFDAWMVRGDGVTCLFQGPHAAAVCDIEDAVVKEGLTIVVGEGKPRRKGQLAGRFRAYGVMPDSVRAVKVRPLKGEASVVPVRDNAFVFTAETPIEIKRLFRY